MYACVVHILSCSPRRVGVLGGVLGGVLAATPGTRDVVNPVRRQRTDL